MYGLLSQAASVSCPQIPDSQEGSRRVAQAAVFVQTAWASERSAQPGQVLYQQREPFITHIPDASHGPTSQAGPLEGRWSQTRCVSPSHPEGSVLTTPALPAASRVTPLSAFHKPSLGDRQARPWPSDHSPPSSGLSFVTREPHQAPSLVGPWTPLVLLGSGPPGHLCQARPASQVRPGFFPKPSLTALCHRWTRQEG